MSTHVDCLELLQLHVLQVIRFYLPGLINTSKGEDSKFAFHCQEILLHCFDMPARNELNTQNPHVLMTFNPSESIAMEVFRNISIIYLKRGEKNKILTQLFLTATPRSSGSEKEEEEEEAQFHHTRKCGLLPFDRLVASEAE